MWRFSIRIRPVVSYVNTEAGGTGLYSTFWASQIAIDFIDGTFKWERQTQACAL